MQTTEEQSIATDKITMLVVCLVGPIKSSWSSDIFASKSGGAQSG